MYPGLEYFSLANLEDWYCIQIFFLFKYNMLSVQRPQSVKVYPMAIIKGAHLKVPLITDF